MSKVKYKAPTQATSKFIWNGFQILPGYIYGRDALGLYVIENAYKNDIETHSKSFKMYRRMPGKDNARYNNWVYVAANTNSDKTLAQIVRIASKGDIYLKDYMRNDVFYAMKPRYYKTVNGKIAHFYGTKELPQTSHSECLTTHRCKVSKGYNTSNMPVSYTHLDVYKRQEIFRRNINIAIVPNSYAIVNINGVKDSFIF